MTVYIQSDVVKPSDHDKAVATTQAKPKMRWHVIKPNEFVVIVLELLLIAVSVSFGTCAIIVLLVDQSTLPYVLISLST